MTDQTLPSSADTLFCLQLRRSAPACQIQMREPIFDAWDDEFLWSEVRASPNPEGPPGGDSPSKCSAPKRVFSPSPRFFWVFNASTHRRWGGHTHTALAHTAAPSVWSRHRRSRLFFPNHPPFPASAADSQTPPPPRGMFSGPPSAVLREARERLGRARQDCPTPLSFATADPGLLGVLDREIFEGGRGGPAVCLQDGQTQRQRS